MEPKHILDIDFDELLARPTTASFEACESEAEHIMLAALMKTRATVLQQVPAVGYRLDFVLEAHGCGRIGVEVDGAQFHDRYCDYARDKKILQSLSVREIVRIPAAAVIYFRDATMQAISEWYPQFSSPVFAMTWEDARRDADRIAEDAWNYGDAEAREYSDNLAFGEAYSVSDLEAWVGSPLAFVDRDHAIWQYVDRKKRSLHRSRQAIVRRTLATMP